MSEPIEIRKYEKRNARRRYRWANDLEYRARIQAYDRERKSTPEFRAKKSAKRKQQWANDPLMREKSRLYGKRWRAQPGSLEKARIVHSRVRRQVAAGINALKLLIRCERCGGTSHLDFHHKDRATKRFEINATGVEGHSADEQWEEISRCELLCRSCHCKADNLVRNLRKTSKCLKVQP